MGYKIIFCQYCGQKLQIEDNALGSVQCPICNGILTVQSDNENISFSDIANVFTKVNHSISDSLGVEKLTGFSFKKLFSAVLKKHSWIDVENAFTVGAAVSTPSLDEIEVKWPTPWLFIRMLIFTIGMHFMFYWIIIIDTIFIIVPSRIIFLNMF